MKDKNELAKIFEEYSKNIIDFKLLSKSREAEFYEFEFRNDIINKLYNKLYLHQVEALSNLYNNKNVIVTTPTGESVKLSFY
ncbi:hypothetical protein ACPB8Q_04430 [Methanocaldococcus indicus]|uniref:hypothetical protein n=1 Tax=Methanocaldococcus indicus TaxID=213231 RepID=UPI003C6CD10D